MLELTPICFCHASKPSYLECGDLLPISHYITKLELEKPTNTDAITTIKSLQPGQINEISCCGEGFRYTLQARCLPIDQIPEDAARFKFLVVYFDNEGIKTNLLFN